MKVKAVMNRILRLFGLPPCENIYEGRGRIQQVLHELDLLDEVDEIIRLAFNNSNSE